jgi:hypothetical protein
MRSCFDASALSTHGKIWLLQEDVVSKEDIRKTLCGMGAINETRFWV